jgi:hypothetical protein
VLLVTGNPRATDALYVSAAIDAMPELAFELEQVAPAALSEMDLAGYALVVVGDGGALAEADADALREYAEDGGAIFMALGQRAATLDQVPVTGHEFQTVAAFGNRADDFAVVGSLDRTHPALRSADALRSARFFRYLSVAPEPGDGVMVSLDDGTSLLIDHDLGDGRVLLFASSLDREWNNLPVQPVFVPWLAGLSAYLTGDLVQSSEVSLGSTLSPRMVGLSGGQIFSPDGAQALGLAGAATGQEVLLDQLGFYEIVGSGQTELVAVNADPRESNLASMEPNAVTRWLSLASEEPAAAPGSLPELGEAPPTPLWPWILGLLAVIAVVESWVGNWHLRVRRGIAA